MCDARREHGVSVGYPLKLLILGSVKQPKHLKGIMTQVCISVPRSCFRVPCDWDYVEKVKSYITIPVQDAYLGRSSYLVPVTNKISGQA